jgi:5-methyltetrahydrofolate--homocysteine methyltransferase
VETVLASKTKTVVMGPDRPFCIIGERINPTGRKKLAEEMRRGDMSRVRSDALAQVEAGAHVLDVNAGVPGADEPALLAAAVKLVMETMDVPLCFDSPNHAALEAALAIYEGKPLINSVTGEDRTLERVLPLVKKYNAVVIGMANDETGISNDPEVRLAVARKIVQRAQDYGIPPEDVLIDPLALTVGANHQAAAISLETLRLVRRELGVNTSIGASNISFGLPDRLALNCTFLSMAIACGLTAAITNPLEPEIYKTILAANLMMGHDEYAMNWIRAYRKVQKA